MDNYFSQISSLSFEADAFEYLEMWSEQFATIKTSSWILLIDVPQWPEIELTMKGMIERKIFAMEDSSNLFDQYNYVRTYLTTEKLNDWNMQKTGADKRWAQTFLHLNSRNIPCDKMSMLVEYVLCLPGTSATVERVFSQVNRIWSNEKTAMLPKTVESILYVKYNLNYSCIEFFKLLKKNQQLLREIMSSNKYMNMRHPSVPELENEGDEEELHCATDSDSDS